jgi:hypothetical protein
MVVWGRIRWGVMVHRGTVRRGWRRPVVVGVGERRRLAVGVEQQQRGCRGEERRPVVEVVGERRGPAVGVVRRPGEEEEERTPVVVVEERTRAVVVGVHTRVRVRQRPAAAVDQREPAGRTRLGASAGRQVSAPALDRAGG